MSVCAWYLDVLGVSLFHAQDINRDVIKSSPGGGAVLQHLRVSITQYRYLYLCVARCGKKRKLAY